MIDEDGKRHATKPAPLIPPHMADGAHTATQQKAFAEWTSNTAKSTGARKSTAKKSGRKRTAKKAEAPSESKE